MKIKSKKQRMAAAAVGLAATGGGYLAYNWHLDGLQPVNGAEAGTYIRTTSIPGNLLDPDKSVVETDRGYVEVVDSFTATEGGSLSFVLLRNGTTLLCPSDRDRTACREVISK